LISREINPGHPQGGCRIGNYSTSSPGDLLIRVRPHHNSCYRKADVSAIWIFGSTHSSSNRSGAGDPEIPGACGIPPRSRAVYDVSHLRQMETANQEF